MNEKHYKRFCLFLKNGMILLLIILALSICIKSTDLILENKEIRERYDSCKALETINIPAHYNETEEHIQHYCYDMSYGGIYNPQQHAIGNGKGLI